MVKVSTPGVSTSPLLVKRVGSDVAIEDFSSPDSPAMGVPLGDMSFVRVGMDEEEAVDFVFGLWFTSLSD